MKWNLRSLINTQENPIKQRLQTTLNRFHELSLTCRFSVLTKLNSTGYRASKSNNFDWRPFSILEIAGSLILLWIKIISASIIENFRWFEGETESERSKKS